MLGKTASETERKAQKWRQEILDELVALIESPQRRRRALELLEELKVTDNMLVHAHPQAVIGSYAAYKDPSHAVAAYLELKRTPATLDEILDALFRGGYRGGYREGFELSVKMAIQNRLTGKGRHDEKYGLKGSFRGYIGLKAWDDELFNL